MVAEKRQTSNELQKIQNQKDADGFVLRRIKEYKVLPQSEELALLTAWQKEKDPAAIQKLIRHNIRLVAQFAFKYRNSVYTREVADLVQEGTLGLVKACTTYKLDSGYKLSTYAWYVIRTHIDRWSKDTRGPIRVPIHYQENELMLIKQEYQKAMFEEGRTLTSAELAKRTGLSQQEVESCKAFIDQHNSLNETAHSEKRQDAITSLEVMDTLVYDSIIDPEEQFEEEADKAYIRTIIAKLPAKDAGFIKKRFGLGGNPRTHAQLAAYYQVSHNRIKLTERRILSELKKLIDPAMLNYFRLGDDD